MRKLAKRFRAWLSALGSVVATRDELTATREKLDAVSRILGYCADCSCALFLGNGSHAVSVEVSGAKKLVCKFCAQKYAAQIALSRRRQA